MSASPPIVRRGEYAARGDYHRTPDPDWEYYPTYLAKLEAVRGWLDAVSPGTRVLDAGCGEGVLVDEYAGRLAIEGIDPNYGSDRVRTASLTALPFPEATFVSTAFRQMSTRRGKVDGQLTLMGKTKPVTFDVELVGAGKGFAGQPRIGATARGRLKPVEFGLSPLLGETIEIVIDGEFQRTP